MAPSFLHFPSYFASTNYAEPTSQSTGPYAQVFNQTYWAHLTSTPKLKMDLDNYMAAHKKGGSSLVDLLPHSRLVEGYNPAFSPTLLVDIGGGVGHQCKDLKARYPSLPGEVVVQDLQCAKDLELAGNGIRGMAYDFFEAQPVRGELKRDFSSLSLSLSLSLHRIDGLEFLTDVTCLVQMRDSTTTAPSCTTGRTPSASRSCRMWPTPCGRATRDC